MRERELEFTCTECGDVWEYSYSLGPHRKICEPCQEAKRKEYHRKYDSSPAQRKRRAEYMRKQREKRK